MFTTVTVAGSIMFEAARGHYRRVSPVCLVNDFDGPGQLRRDRRSQTRYQGHCQRSLLRMP